MDESFELVALSVEGHFVGVLYPGTDALGRRKRSGKDDERRDDYIDWWRVYPRKPTLAATHKSAGISQQQT
jgi:hypothetical protein